jgi:hypothetical protein
MNKVAVGVLALSAAAWGAQAAAQSTSAFERDRNVSVRERPHPEYVADGLPAGGFTLYPRATIDGEWNDNIFAVETGEDSDFIYRFRPELRLSSNWSRHSLGAFARASVNRYTDFTSEDSTDWNLGTDGRVDVVGNSYLFGNVQFGRFTEARTSQGVPGNAAEPVQYDLFGGAFGAVQELNRLRFTERLDVNTFDYDRVARVGGGSLDLNDRDRTVTVASGRAEYAVSPATAIFVSGAWNNRDYDVTSVPSRDSDGYVIGVGANFDLTNLMRGEVELGYLHQNYKDPAVDDVSGLAVRGKVDWFPTQLTTVSFDADRSAQDTGVGGSAGYISTSGGVQVDHELLRNVILTARAGFTNNDFQGVDREDDVWSAGVGANYLMNRNVGFSVGYSYYSQDSKGVDEGPDFTVNRVMASVTLQF